jgi:hypothetical protein
MTNIRALKRVISYNSTLVSSGGHFRLNYDILITIGTNIKLYETYFAIVLSNYVIYVILETIGLSDIGSRTQSIGLPYWISDLQTIGCPAMLPSNSS